MSIRVQYNDRWLTRTSGLNNFNSPYTVMLWFKRMGTTYYGHCWAATVATTNTSGNYQNSDYCGLNSDCSAFVGSAYNAGSNTGEFSGGSPTLNTWVHVAIVRESATSLKLYVDGTLIGTATQDITGRAAVGAELIGNLNAAYHGDGEYAAFKSWSRALTQAEVAAEMGYYLPVDSTNIHSVSPLTTQDLTPADVAEALTAVTGTAFASGGTNPVTLGASEPAIGWAPVVTPYVQGDGNATTSALTSISKAFAADVTAGNLVVVVGIKYTGSADVGFVAGDCTKSAGTAVLGTISLDHQYRIDTVSGGVNFQAVGLFSAVVEASGSLTMQLTDSAGRWWVMGILELPGVWNASRVEDTGEGGTATDNTSPAVSGSMTAAGRAFFVGGIGVTSGYAATFTPAAEFFQAYAAETIASNLGSIICREVDVGAADSLEWAIASTDQSGFALAGVVYRPVGSGGLTASQQVDSFSQTAELVGDSEITGGGLFPDYLSASQQVGDFTQSASVTVDPVVAVSLSASQQVGDFAQAATAAVENNTQASQSVGNFSQTATAKTDVAASASQQVGGFAQVAAAEVTVSASASQQVGDFTQTASAESVDSASADQQVGDFAQAATAAVQIDASAAQQVGSFAQSSSAEVVVGASAAQQVGDFAQSANITLQDAVSVSASQQVGSFAQTATAKVDVSSSASQQVGAFSQAAAVATLNDGNAYASAAPVSTVAPGAAASGGAEASAGAASIQLQVAQATASVSAVASAAAASLALSPALAAATGSATATANVPAVQAAAPSASATGGGGAVATAHAAPIFSAAPAATASGNANVAANAAALSSQPPSGTAFAGSGAVASGALAALTTVAPAASASGAALVAGSPSSVQVGAPGASASAAATASANFNPISVAALQGGASVHVATSAGFQGIQLLPAAGGAQGSASASAVPALLRAFPPQASFAGYSVYVDDARLVPYRGARRKVPALLKNRTVNKDRP